VREELTMSDRFGAEPEAPMEGTEMQVPEEGTEEDEE
jgi:hypothetical protein